MNCCCCWSSVFGVRNNLLCGSSLKRSRSRDVERSLRRFLARSLLSLLLLRDLERDRWTDLERERERHIICAHKFKDGSMLVK